MSMRGLIAGVLLLAACSGRTAEDSLEPFAPAVAVPVSIRNDADVPIVYFAVGEGSLALIATPATLLPHEYGERLVSPGETVRVRDILGYRADLGVRFYVWLVDEAADRGRYRGVFLVTPRDLGRDGGLVVYSDEMFRP